MPILRQKAMQTQLRKVKEEKRRVETGEKKKMFKRLIYWLTNKHHCKRCCLFCRYYERCKNDEE